MARQGWGRHTVVATGSNDGTKQVSVTAWNNDLDTDGVIGSTPETIASGSTVTPTNSLVKLSGSTSIDTIAITNTSEGDILWVYTSGSVTLNNTSSPSSDGDIKLLADANKDLSTTVPTSLIRISTYWYEFAQTADTVTAASTTTFTNKSIDLTDNTLTGTSLELKTAISDETGSGSLVFATSPTLVTPALGTPASGVATNLTGTAASLTAGNATLAATVTTNANLTGDVTSSGNATTIATDAVDIAMLSATGTASSTTYLRGDNTWSTAGGAALDADNTWTGNQNFNSFIQSMSTVLTISSASVTATRSTHRLDTEGSASTDTLTHMNGYDYGRIVILTTNNSSRDVTITDEAGGAGSLNMEGDFTMDNYVDTITFCGRFSDGATFMELSRSNNG